VALVFDLGLLAIIANLGCREFREDAAAPADVFGRNLSQPPPELSLL